MARQFSKRNLSFLYQYSIYACSKDLTQNFIIMNHLYCVDVSLFFAQSRQNLNLQKRQSSFKGNGNLVLEFN
jgi:hypothetical protein